MTETPWWLQDVTNYTGSVEEWEYVVRGFSGMSGTQWLRTSCPRCLEQDGKSDGKKSLGYNTRTGGYNCFRCGMKGSLPPTYRDRLGGGIDPVVHAGPEIVEPVRDPPENALGYTPLFEGPAYASLIYDRSREYLVGSRALKCRGLRESACKEAGIGASIIGKFNNRVIVPIADLDGRLDLPWRGWVSRTVPPARSTAPYMYAKGMDRIGLLYNAQALLVETSRPVYVVEGTLDAIALWPDAVAVLGKPLESQIELLLAADRPVAVCLDGDAWMEGWALAMSLVHRGKLAVNVRMPPKTDPDEVPREALDECVDAALIDGYTDATLAPFL
jgi:hypothetical protein